MYQCDFCGRDFQDCICGREDDNVKLEIARQSDTTIEITAGGIFVMIDLHAMYGNNAVSVRVVNDDDSYGEVYATQPKG